MTVVFTRDILYDKMMFDDDSSVSRLRFPQKLWHLMNTRDDAILWGNNGRTILLNYNILNHYLRCNQSIFKTTHISSFIRQLNLYGFRKVTSHSQDPLCNLNNPYLHEYTHDYFQHGKAELVPLIKRKLYNMNKLSNTQTPAPRIAGCYKSEIVLEARKALKIALKKAARRWVNQKYDLHGSSNQEEIDQENITEQKCESEIIQDFGHYEDGDEKDSGYRFNGDSFEVYQDESVYDGTFDSQASSNVEESHGHNGNIIIEMLDETGNNAIVEEIVLESQYIENTESDGSQFLIKSDDSTYESFIVEEPYIDVTDEKYDFEKECIEHAAMYGHQEVGAPWEYDDSVVISDNHAVKANDVNNENDTTNEWKELYSQISSTMDLLQS